MLKAFFAAVLVCSAAAPAAAAEVQDTLVRPATRAARPEQGVLLGLAQAGTRLVAVGERGLIVVSDDQGKSWRQVNVPLSVTLTAVSFPTATQGWAVGHRGVILATQDGGLTWSVQLDGKQYAERHLAAVRAQAQQPGVSETQFKRALADAQSLVGDGADKPFLDVSFADARRGIAVGAYGLCARTEDAGASWLPCATQLDNPKGAHLYAIARSERAVYITGEQGVLLRSDDGESGFSAVSVPYNGSFFCMGIAGNGDIVLGGLRGTAFVSTNQGRSFEALPADSPGSLSGAVRLADGRLLLVNQLGQLLHYDAAGRRLRLLPAAPMPPLSDVLQLPSGDLIVAGVRGVSPLAAAGLLPVSRTHP